MLTWNLHCAVTTFFLGFGETLPFQLILKLSYAIYFEVSYALWKRLTLSWLATELDRRNDSLCSMASYVLRVSGSISRLSDVEFHDKGMFSVARVAVDVILTMMK